MIGPADMLTTCRGVLAELGLADEADAGGLEILGDPDPPGLASPLAVADCAVASVVACLVAGAELAAARSGRRPDVSVATAQVAAAMHSERLLRDPSGRAMGGFAPLSRLWLAADGWVRSHANYPWHRSALLRALQVGDGDDADVEGPLGATIAGLPAAEIERRVYAAGGLAVAARSAGEWRSSDAGRAAGSSPLVATAPLGTGRRPLPAPGGLPAAGLRVLDLTRVIAGPVGTRMLAALGAEVLRVDDPARPELALHAVDGVIGKASTTVDARTHSGREVLHSLLDAADVLVTGYRPAALRSFGLDPDQVAERHPDTVVVTLSAWGSSGPWGYRRGFDSLVQVASGIGWAASADGQRPGALPCQLLDHATGYLLAAGALAALARRVRSGQVSHVRVSLARSAQWLLDQGGDPVPRLVGGEPGVVDAGPYRVALGDGWSSVGPPGSVGGHPLTWPHLPPAYGGASPAWP